MSSTRLVIATVSFFAVATPAQAANQTVFHTIEKGDTLWDLSRRTGCTVEQLRRANPKGDALRVGDRFELPQCGAATPVATPSRVAPTPRAASKDAPAKVRAASPRLARPDAAGLPPPPQAAETTVRAKHVVTRGETVARIAKRYGVTEQGIRTLNDLSERSTILVGQILLLPTRTGLAAAPTLALSPEAKIRVVLGQSVGRPDRGRLIGGVQLPHDAAIYRRHPAKAYGTQHAVDHTLAAIRAVKQKHPGVHRLAIGDLSHQRGGPINGHRSHQSGRDVDLGLYHKRPPSQYPNEFVRASVSKIDVSATWTLVESLAAAARKPGGPEYIFLDYGLQKELYEYARSQGVSKSRLAQIFQYPHGRRHREGLVRHEPNHGDHIHVRFSCPPKDAKCK